jgi:hypothetical protein
MSTCEDSLVGLPTQASEISCVDPAGTPWAKAVPMEWMLKVAKATRIKVFVESRRPIKARVMVRSPRL